MLDIIQRTVNILEQITDNMDRLALINILNCKLAHLVMLKSAKFRQYSNSIPRIMTYYSMNFLNSGSNKDYCTDLINNCFLSFVKEKMQIEIDDYKQRYEYEQSQTRVGKKEQEKIQNEINAMRVPNLELLSPNYTGLYKEAEQINKIGFGCICIRLAELGDYLDAVVGGNQQKKELWQKMKDIYEGTIAPNIVAGDNKRETLENIPVVALMYTDFENLLNPKVKDYYLMSLKTGMARRSFIYIPQNQNKLSYPKRPADKETAFFQAKKVQEQYKNIFDKIENNAVYQLSEEAKEYIYQYQCRCVDYYNESKDNIIVKLERKESFWKITKLAVVYSIIDNPLNTIVTTKYVKMAEDFYNMISPSLKSVIEKRKKSEIEIFAEYINNNSERIITNSELRGANIVSGNRFKDFWGKHFDEINEELKETYNKTMYEYNEGRKKSWQVINND